jgi:hypothetical protein
LDEEEFPGGFELLYQPPTQQQSEEIDNDDEIEEIEEISLKRPRE